MDLSIITIKEIATKLKAKEISSEELVSLYLKRISEENEGINALLETSSSALSAAKHIDERRADNADLGPLAGIPIVLKDNITVQGWEATAGSRILEGYKASYNATVTNRLREAGVILLGRANCDEFAMGSSTETSHFGPTKNPWDKERVPGGSSGGSAAAISAGFAPMALGTDTGGSIRQPAALCGVTGLKPTYGRVSRYGLIAMASSLDQIGPLTHTVEDAAMIMQVIEGRDQNDATSIELSQTSIPELIKTDVKGLKIGIPKEYFVDGMNQEVEEIVMRAIKEFEAAGAELVEVSLPHTKYALATYYIIMPCEVSSNLGRFDGIRYGYSSSAEDLISTYERTRGEGFGPEAKRRIMLGAYSLSAGYYDQYYRKALKVRQLIKNDFDQVFKDVDLIIGPTTPTTAWKIGEKFNDPLTMYLSDIYTIAANLAAIPALSVPCGLSNGLPIGLQLMAKPFNEDTLYQAGMFYQSITDWHQQSPG
ncbi:Asp-tRNA(Asn)/Glu-tRNA(Gln) amidotransferase subunit GatA [Patescibacteria group bacterium]